ncbi:MAG: DUF3592 domain-containing protein [Pseudomonadota bacterium]
MLNLILLVFGAIMLFAGWHSLKEQRQLLKRGVQTQARVVDITEFRARNGQLNYKPVWAFQDEAGIEHRLPLGGNHEQSTSRSTYNIGDTMKVVYDPDSPDRVYGVGAKQNFGIALYLLVSIGLIGYVVADTTGLIG